MLALVKKSIEELLERQEQVLVAIDGSCTAGKTTLAGILAGEYECNVVHMDDFFLRPEQRTPERYAEVGGNVDYERFREEVLTALISGGAFSYQAFDCKTLTLKEPITVMPKKLTIIEGTYCCHPYFENPYDLKIFLTVEEELQKARILERPAHLHRRFFEDWIPMEHRYFEGMDIAGNADIVISFSGKI